ncbi:MAG TPA: Na/Pi cotransporter family protein [Myxococcota bacterium]|nr:Na/Pi cotransporter family protein [Myxococcota bacterium]
MPHDPVLAQIVRRYRSDSRFPISALGMGLLLLLTARPALGAEAGVASLDWSRLLMALFGGLALFLFGLDMLSEGLKKAAGQTLRTALGRLTKNRFAGALTGAFVTAVLNSSSVTTVLVVGFVTAGVMTLAQSVGVIMGANIGSTATAQLLAFNLSAWALVPVAVGFFLLFAGRADRTREMGTMIMGLGLVFYGMGVMSDGMKPLRTHPPFIEILQKMERPVFGIFAGALFTALVQSSAATVGIAIAMATEGLLSLPAGIALALGSNIGTCVTALLAAIGKPTEAIRAAVVHLLFNVVGVLVWIGFIPLLASLAVSISPESSELEGAARAAAEVPRQIANANTLFNVANTLLFIPFTGWFARLAEWLVAARSKPSRVLVQPQYLDEAALAAPSLALEGVRLEIGEMGEIAAEMLEAIGPALRDRSLSSLDAIALRDDDVDVLEAALLEYLGKIRQRSLTEEDSREQQRLVAATLHLEGLADVVASDLVELARSAGDQRGEPAGELRGLLEGLYEAVSRAVRLAVEAVRNRDATAAAEVVRMRETIREEAEHLLARQAQQLEDEAPDDLLRVRLRVSFVDQMRRIYTLARRVAEVDLPPALSRRR